MQQFTIPQFIDVEDKIIGPITTRQFVIILGSLMVMAVFYKIFDFSLFLVASIFVFLFMIAFAFVKINGRPFHFFVLNIVQTFKRAKIRIWNNSFGKSQIVSEKTEEKVAVKQIIPVKHYTTSRLAELSLIVDTGGAFESDEDDNNMLRQ